MPPLKGNLIPPPGHKLVTNLHYYFSAYEIIHTGLLVIQNAQHLFCSMTLDRRNYWAELDEILHGTLLGYSTWDSRGVF